MYAVSDPVCYGYQTVFDQEFKVPVNLAKDGQKGMCLKSDYRNYAYMANLDYIKCVGLAYDYNYCPGMCDDYGATHITTESSVTIQPGQRCMWEIFDADNVTTSADATGGNNTRK